MADPVGAFATVLTRVPGDGRPGSVRLVFQGATDTWLAYSDAPQEAGTTVLVFGVRPGRGVDVMACPPGLLDAVPRA